MQKRDEITFNGITFVRFPEGKSLSSRRYYYPFAKGRRVKGVGGLHQEIWKAHHGPIPKGMHVHHKDENSLNNSIDNLELLTHGEHMKRHGNNSPAQRAHFARIRPLAAAWHGSPEGLEWHSQLGKDSWKDREPDERKCVECGKTYLCKSLRDTDRFCSSACMQKWHYHRKTYFVKRICSICGQEFMAQPRSGRRLPQQTCSLPCRNELLKRKFHDRKRTVRSD